MIVKLFFIFVVPYIQQKPYRLLGPVFDKGQTHVVIDMLEIKALLAAFDHANLPEGGKVFPINLLLDLLALQDAHQLNVYAFKLDS